MMCWPGQAGADTLSGGAGVDEADYSASGAGVNVSLATGTGSGGDAAGDLLTGIENLTGSDQADVLTGDASDNVLDGGAGDDALASGLGADTLIGGAGVDTADYSDSDAAVTVDLVAAQPVLAVMRRAIRWRPLKMSRVLILPTQSTAMQCGQCARRWYRR